jgi:hypothetical protein
MVEPGERRVNNCCVKAALFYQFFRSNRTLLRDEMVD